MPVRTPVAHTLVTDGQLQSWADGIHTGRKEVSSTCRIADVQRARTPDRCARLSRAEQHAHVGDRRIRGIVTVVVQHEIVAARSAVISQRPAIGPSGKFRRNQS